MKKYINNNFQRYIIKDLLDFKIDYNDNKLLTENDEWIMKRNALNDKITNYKNIKKFFENL